MNRESVKGMIEAISREMSENRDYLVELDQVNGDGDLGISMDEGYQAAEEFVKTAKEKDLGKLFMACGKVFNAAAPSSLGTITSFGFMGMAKALKGKEEADFKEGAEAMLAAVESIMGKAESKPGEKTIIDSLYPGVHALIKYASDPYKAVLEAEKAAAEGAESTRQMRAVHGRAAYSAERSIGMIDGGAVAGKLIFKGLAAYYKAKK